MVRKNTIITATLFCLCLMQIQGSIKTLSSACLCDISSSCDQQCCCDKECPSQAVSYWNTYSLCANDGFTIPFCTTFYSQPIQLYDLYQGLRLIYTVVKRLFCISRVNFIDTTSTYITTSTDSQIPTLITSLSAINPNILALSPITAYSSLPQRNGMGLCQTTSALRNLNNVNDHCRVYVSTLAALSNNSLLSISQFMTSNGFNSSLNVYYMQSPSSISPTRISNILSVPACINGATTSMCYVIKQLVLYFISSTSTTIDYTSSYVVLGLTTININSPSYLHLKFSYQFIPAVGSYPYASNQGYTFGSYLTLINSVTNSTNTSYYRVFNPINLAFRKLDGTCRSTTNNTDNADQTNLVRLRFGINGFYTCLGTNFQTYDNLVGAFNLVGAIGSASNNLNDYVSVKFPSSTSPVQKNENLQLLFHYISIGSQQNPQYQIMRAEVKVLGISANNQPTLFVQYQPLNNNVFLNVPTPPTIDAYLPDDFLYPFYVA